MAVAMQTGDHAPSQTVSPTDDDASVTSNGGVISPGNKEGLLQASSVGRAHASKMVGPQWIQTLRGELLGRKVALICCGEAHEGVPHRRNALNQWCVFLCVCVCVCVCSMCVCVCERSHTSFTSTKSLPMQMPWTSHVRMQSRMHGITSWRTLTQVGLCSSHTRSVLGALSVVSRHCRRANGHVGCCFELMWVCMRYACVHA